jgi:hypothetical protein
MGLRSRLAAGLQRRFPSRVAGLVHDLHRVFVPFTRRALLPLDTAALESQLRDVHAAFAAAEIPFWLRDGTALGAWREGGLIPHDDDADLGIWAADRERAESVMAGLAEAGFVRYKSTATVVGYLRDLETVEFVVSGLAAPEDEYARVLEGFFAELAPIPFLGLDFLVPRRTEEYLEFLYGPDWRTPRPGAFWSNSVWLRPDERRALARRYLPPSGSGGGSRECVRGTER